MSSIFVRRTALAVALATGAASLVAVSPSVAKDSPSAARTVELTGTLLVRAGEGGKGDSYSVRRPNGQVVPIDPGTVEAFDHDVASSDRFSGRVELPVEGRASSLRGAAQGGIALPVMSASIQARPTTSGPVVHRLAVAQVNNLGAFSRDPAALMAQVKVATDYWIDQADGKIASYEVPVAPVSYATTKTTVASGCGLIADSEFDPVVAEASALFPGYDFVNGTDQLVVLMPDTCYPATGSATVGLARRGVSLTSGGPMLALNFEFLGDTIAHEFGHTYGLKHAESPSQTYGDIYEVMGAADNRVSPELGTGYRHEQGLLQPGEVVSLTGVSSTTTVRDRAATAETGVRGAEVIDPDNGTRIWFDLRTGQGSDAGSEYRTAPTIYSQAYRAAGVVVEADLEAGLRMQFPNSQTALAAGETWSNASGTMKVTVPTLDTAGGVATLTSTYAPGAAVTGGTVTLLGTPRVFGEVSATGAGFVPAAAGLRYQWFANGAPIPDADSAVLDIPLALAGAALTVQVTGYAAGRAPSAPVTSTPVTVAPAELRSAMGAGSPTLSGKGKTGQVLTATGIAWVGEEDGLTPAGLTSAFQWYRGRKAIEGATAATYRLTPADLRKKVFARTLVSAPGYASAYSDTRSTSRVKKGKLPSATPTIKLKGTKAKVGTKLKVRTGSWLGRTKFRFQWYAGKRKIRGADNKTLKVSRGLRKKKVSVRVTGSKKGYRSTTRKSKGIKIR